MENLHPFNGILHWFDSLPPSYRTKVAVVYFSHLPGFTQAEELFAVDRGETFFRQWFSPEQRAADVVIGKAVTFRALIDFGCRNFFSRNRQEEMVSEKLRFKAESLREGDMEMVEYIDKAIDKFAFRGAQWLKVSDSWEMLCDNELSDAALEEYEYMNPPGANSPQSV